MMELLFIGLGLAIFAFALYSTISSNEDNDKTGEKHTTGTKVRNVLFSIGCGLLIASFLFVIHNTENHRAEELAPVVIHFP